MYNKAAATRPVSGFTTFHPDVAADHVQHAALTASLGAELSCLSAGRV
jgi:hypothetical protein